jgi:pimeloyl-ACP methyl ester carboxylesterase
MTPFLLIPGLNCDSRVYNSATASLWQFGSVTVASHLEGEGVAGIARNILAGAPPKFSLGGFSMGGYVAFEILRQAPERVLRLALIDTRAEEDPPEAIELRRRRIALARGGKFGLVVEQSFPDSVHPDNVGESRLYSLHRTMAEANGPEAYVRHQEAIIGRPDSRSLLSSIAVPTVIVVGEGDKITPPSSADVMHRGIAGSVLNVIPRAGHLALLEQPQLVDAALRAWAAA